MRTGIGLLLPLLHLYLAVTLLSDPCFIAAYLGVSVKLHLE
jgi:hypothetical protein